MTPNIDIYRSAHLLIQQHGGNAAIHAAMEADRHGARGNMTARAIWKRIVNAIHELQDDSVPVGAMRH